MRSLAVIALLIALSGCGAYDALSNGMAFSKAVEADVVAQTGVKPQVGFQWNNGTLTSVTVAFPKVYSDKPLAELSDLVRAAVIKEFKQKPKAIYLSFGLEP